MGEPRLAFSLPRAAALDPATVRALWDLRMRIMRLDPAVAPADDRAAFTARVRGGRRVAIGRDRAGVIRAMYVGHGERRTIGGPRINLLTPEYGFVEAPWRGDPFIALAFLATTLDEVARAPLRPALLVGSMYPASYLRFVRAGRPWTLLDDPPPWIAAALRDVGTRHYGDRWDPTTGLVALPTRPPPLSPHAARTAVERAALAHYERLAPDWRAGRAVLGALPLDARALRGALRVVARRAARRWR